MFLKFTPSHPRNGNDFDFCANAKICKTKFWPKAYKSYPSYYVLPSNKNFQNLKSQNF